MNNGTLVCIAIVVVLAFFLFCDTRESFTQRERQRPQRSKAIRLSLPTRNGNGWTAQQEPPNGGQPTLPCPDLTGASCSEDGQVLRIVNGIDCTYMCTCTEDGCDWGSPMGPQTPNGGGGFGGAITLTP